jgi:threonine dehydrogenase-like Zn-dependent dehydrogenase
MVGCSVARVAAGMPGTRVTLVDVDPSRAAVAEALGVGFAGPDTAEPDQDLVVHTTATSSGLETSLALLAPDTSVLDLSWYGDREVHLSLGSRFHSARLGIRASQVGTLAPARAGRRTYLDRLQLALHLLRDPAFDALLTGTSTLAALPGVMARLADGDSRTLCHTVTYEED